MLGLTLSPPKPKAIVPIRLDPKDELLLREYEDLCEKLGLPSVMGNPKVIAFEEFAKANGIPIYDKEMAIRYMDWKAARESKKHSGWVWKPLRPVDAERTGYTQWGTEGRETYRRPIPYSNFYYQGHNACTRYTRKVPIEVLQQVAFIEERAPQKMAFLVSDYAPKLETRNPDPFLLAVLPHCGKDGRFIIAVWDEPGFTTGLKD